MAIFKGGESDVSTTIFKERKKYKENFKIDGYTFLDTWYENPFYSKLNENFEPVYLDEDLAVKNLSEIGDLAPRVKTSPFLVRAYLAFVQEYATIVQNTNIGFPVFLEGLVPTSGHVNFEQLYGSYVNYVSSRFVAKIRNESDKYNFNQFMQRLVYHTLQSGKYYPLTRSGFLMSNNCPVGVTGMSLQLTNLPSDLDTNKSLLYEDEAFKCYLDFSRAHGLIVDKNLPWRLYADLTSPKMQEYIVADGSRSYLDYLNRFYRTKPAFDDYSALFNLGISAYLDYSGLLAGNIFGQAMTQFKTERLTAEEGFLGFFLKVRMLELGIPLSKYEENFEKLLDLHRVYSVRYESQGKNRLDPAFGEVLRMTSSRYKAILQNRNIDSYARTTLKDYN